MEKYIIVLVDGRTEKFRTYRAAMIYAWDIDVDLVAKIITPTVTLTVKEVWNS